MVKPEIIVLNVDPGTDDFVSLLLCLYAEKIGQIAIAAIICSLGNASLANTCKNVVRILQVTGRTDIPLYRGASQPIIPPRYPANSFYGTDGFGDLPNLGEPDLSIIKENFDGALNALVTQNPGQVALISLGPLTNIALTIRRYEKFASNLKSVWIMGGNFDGAGNVERTVSEFNFYTDPEAAYIVFNSVSVPIYVLTWQTCKQPKISLDWRFNVFGAKNSAAIQLLNKIEQKVYGTKNLTSWDSCDSFLTASFVDRTHVIAKKSRHNITVELDGTFTRGEMIADLQGMDNYKNNVFVIEKIDPEAYKQLLLKL